MVEKTHTFHVQNTEQRKPGVLFYHLRKKKKGKLLKNQSPPGQPRLHTLVFVIVIVVKANLLGFLSLLPFWRDATVLQLRAGG